MNNRMDSVMPTLIRFAGKVFIKLGKKLQNFGKKISRAEVAKNEVVQKWRTDEGDQTLRVNYELTSKSLVFDLGGYEGQWASDIYSRYCCQIFIFEPVIEYSQKISERFINNSDIQVFPFGLSGETKCSRIFVSGNSSSLFRNKEGSQIGEIRLVSVVDFFENYTVEDVALMKINIEGGEYDLLDHLISSELIYRIENIQVQFHSFIDDAILRMEDIQRKLEFTHYLTYQYPFVWENWRRKS